MTVRLPFDEAREVSIRAKGRGWSVSDYIGYCVARTLGTRKTYGGNYRANDGGSEYVTLREFPEEAPVDE